MKRICLLIFFICLLIGCSKDVTEDYLVDGHWVGTAGYEDEEIGGDPTCPPFQEGMKFKNENTVYVDAYEEDFEYRLREADVGYEIELYNTNGVIYFYYIKMISDDEMGLIGQGIQEEESCYLVRK